MSRLDSVARMLLTSAIFRPAPEPAEETPILPQVAAARERDRLARRRLAAGEDYQPTEAEKLEARAWSRRRRANG
jgi:hypothetical protein